ncbi:MAG TPA: DUF6603 domain-containing protein [Puia sp.]|nr:DUF6603 domain-containing protein [Puia sp.]
MATVTGTLESVVLELGKLLSPLQDLMGIDMFSRLGVDLPSEIAGDANINAKLSDAAGKAAALDADITTLANAISGGDTTTIISDAIPLITHIGELVTDLVSVGSALQTAAAALPPAEQQKLQDLFSNMAVRTLEYMIVGYLNDNMPVLTSFMSTLGIIDIEPMPSPSLDVSLTTNLPVIPRRFYIDRIPTMFSHPDQYFQQALKWGANDFDGTILFQKLQLLLENLSIPAMIYQTAGQPLSLEAYLFVLQADPTTNPPGLKFEITLPGSTTFDRTQALSTLWQSTLHTEATYDAGLAATLSPPFNLTLHPPTGNVDLKVDLGIKAQKSTGDPVMILGLTGGSGLMAKSISVSVGTDISLGTSGGSVSPEASFSIDEGKLIIDFSQGDGFIQKILSGVHLDADFSLQGTWNPKDGLKLQGQAGVEILIPLHIDLSVVVINGLYFSIGFSSTPPPLQIGLATSITANLGPLVATVDHIGVNIGISFPPDGKGRLGMADLNFAFAPPKGVGLEVDTGIIVGGGFLYLDPDKGQYYGALELEFQDLFSLKAVGIVNTKMPDGSPGFSLLIIITADFTPIQLGFGFTLNGVGGLLGLNRTMNTDKLREGIKTNAIKSVLFPENIIANIDKIISDLVQIFPIYEGHFIVGPMGELGWAAIITLEIGILIEIPDPKIAILGVIRALLPAEDAPILNIQINFLGIIDFENEFISFDASLYDSNLLIYTLTGDMAFRLSWGDNPYFILSVGGFNPAFKDAPADLQNMTRLGISLLNNDYVKVSVTCYFAVTSNTVQFGAKVELYAGAGSFNVYGFLGFDVLIQFDPFHFVAAIYAGLALRSGDSVIMGISLSGQLAGPTPWDVKGDASISILFFSISVSFHETWGDQGTNQVQNTIDIIQLLTDAIADNSNWRAVIPDNNSQHVSVKKIDPGGNESIIHPFGTLTFSERIVPLEVDITRFGNDLPKDAKNFDIEASDPGITTSPVKDQFAAANFFDLTDDQKLSRPSFEPMISGFAISNTSDLLTSTALSEDVDYRLTYLRKKKNILEYAGAYKYAKSYFQSNLKSGAVAQSRLSYAQNRISSNAPDQVSVMDTGYAIANTSDMKLHGSGLTAGSYSEAQGLYNKLLAGQPSLQGQVQIVMEHELNPN